MTDKPETAGVDDVDHLIVDAVDQIRNRFGAAGLRQLIAVATTELDETAQVVAELGDET